MSVKTKLVLAFLSVTLIPLLIVCALTYRSYRESLEGSRLSQLSELAKYKTEKIEAYFAGLESHMRIAQRLRVIRINFPALTSHMDKPSSSIFNAAKRQLDGQLCQMQTVLGLTDIMLLNLDGAIAYSSNPAHFGMDFGKRLPDPRQETFKEGRKGIFLSDLFFNPLENGKPSALLAAPVSDQDGEPLGVLVFELDAAPVYRIIQEKSGLGETGETLVGKISDGKVLFLSPFRHEQDTALKKTISIGDKFGIPMQRAVLGGNGAGKTIDYRGENVIAAWRHIPSLDWGLVAKIDTREAFADANDLGKLTFAVLLVVSSLAAIMAFSVAQSISGPIKDLTRGAEMIGGGNLDYRVGTDSKDEIGTLSRAFDGMALDLKRSIGAAESERRRFHEVLDALPVFVVLITRDYHVPYANRLFEERFGKAEGRRCHEYLFNLSEPCENCGILKVLDTDLPYRWEWEGPDGRHYEVSNFPFVDTDGSRLILEMGIDVTERKLAEAELEKHREHLEELVRERTAQIETANTNLLAEIAVRKRAEERLREREVRLKRSNENLEEFAYVASHDLQEPLRMMASYSELLGEKYGGKIDADADKFINYIIEGAKRMKSLISDLLEFSRTGRTENPGTEIDCNAVLEKVVHAMGQSIGESGAVVTHDKLPALFAVETYFVQLFQNLTANAIKFRSEAPPRIHISAERSANEWIFSVRDNGIGIDPKYNERIFQIFQRLHPRDKYPGTGIGLSICRKIVETWGGRIWVESDPGKGSVFYFTVPVKSEK